MTQEEKMLLLKDLCNRLPYRVIVTTTNPAVKLGVISGISIENKISVRTKYADIVLDCTEVKPYFRPLSNMTEDEAEEYWTKINNDAPEMPIDEIPSIENIAKCSEIVLDWLNTHHFDYRGLIEKNLALDCTGLHIYD